MGWGRSICCSLLLGLLLVTSALASPRFQDNGDQTVTDTQTGLIWTKSANVPGTNLDYQQTRDYVTGMNAAGRFGHQDWRVPNIDELWSLVDHGYQYPSLPAGHPFTGVVTSYSYWSSTPIPSCVDGCPSPENQEVDFGGGNMTANHTWNNDMLWPVRGVMSLSSPGTSALPACLTGASYSQQLSAAWGVPPYTWSLFSGSLPGGLSLNASTGALSGTPVKAGVFSFTVQISDSIGVNEARNLALTVSNVACGFAPVRIGGVTPAGYPDFPGAYANAAQGDVIQLQGLDFSSDLIVNRNLQVSLQGGYDCGYTGNTGATGILGALRVTSGAVKIAKLHFK